MTYRTGAEDDTVVFISYTHVDNQPFGSDKLRWVEHLHEQLTNRVRQIFGGPVEIWRDQKLQGNDVLEESLIETVRTAAALVSVCSPRYVESRWCQMELEEFLEAAALADGSTTSSRSRVFKVVKTPVGAEELPSALSTVLGYEFFEAPPPENRPREFLLSPPDEHWKFYARLDDLAHDIASLLSNFGIRGASQEPDPAPGARRVYLAETTSDVREFRDRLKRDLEARGHRVLPTGPLPIVEDELSDAIDEALQDSDVSVHLLGSRYGVRPEGGVRSVPHVQLDRARIKAEQGGVDEQLIWVPTELDNVEAEQLALMDSLRTADFGEAVDLVRAPLENFKSHLLERLATHSVPSPAIATGHPRRIYLICHELDRGVAKLVRDQLRSAGHTAVLPARSGSEKDLRDDHLAELTISDAVVIFSGRAPATWVRTKLRDLGPTGGLERRGPPPASAVWVLPPDVEDKTEEIPGDTLVLTGSLESNPAIVRDLLELLSRQNP